MRGGMVVVSPCSIQGVFLGCEFGVAALYVWAVGLLAAGQSSTMTGTYAGQYAMEGFLNLRWKQWQRLLVTRSIAILPTLLVTFFEGIENLTEMNDLLNVLMSVQLPFAVIPLLTFTNSKPIMGMFANSIPSKVISMVISLMVIGVNFFFVAIFFKARLVNHLVAHISVAIIFTLYVSFIFYLAYFAIRRDPHCRRHNMEVEILYQSGCDNPALNDEDILSLPQRA
uniref:Natural resistance-associated macrophage protein 1 n=1 Tax=Mesocestoides corti TaxID=53468 RepID=A0A5K3ELF6_MESCO